MNEVHSAADVPADQVMHLIRTTSMRPLQVIAVALCLMLNLIDGFDLLAMAFTASNIAAEWSLAPDRLGLLFSAALLGMASGALLLSPVADMIGRRPTIVGCLMIVASGMLLSARVDSFGELAAARLYTGVGIGAMLSSIAALGVEYASSRRLGLIVGLMAVGFPLGATIGGACATWLIASHGWRSVFLAGGAATLAMVPLNFFLLPESVGYLASKRTPQARQRANRLLGRLRLPAIQQFEAAGGAHPAQAAGLRNLLSPELRLATLALGAVFLLVMASFYAVINWAPKLVAQAGQAAQAGVLVGTLMNAGGVVGGLLSGLLVYRFGLRRVAVTVVALMAAAIVSFGLVAANASLLLPVSIAMGLTMYGALMGLYGLMTTSFPAAVRVTAVGLITTAGRVGSIVGPLAVGMVLTYGVSIPVICLLLAAPPCVAAVVLGVFPYRERH